MATEESPAVPLADNPKLSNKGGPLASRPAPFKKGQDPAPPPEAEAAPPPTADPGPEKIRLSGGTAEFGTDPVEHLARTHLELADEDTAPPKPKTPATRDIHGAAPGDKVGW